MQKENPLGVVPVGTMLRRLAVPAVVANVVNALYNIVDQIFIGQGVGYLGNAATNIAFPLTTICLAIGLMLGVGAASKFNLELGRGHAETARKAAGTTATVLLVAGVALCILVRLFLQPLMLAFGATDAILDYAMIYTGITSFGIPFFLFSTGTNPLVRADGASTFSMLAIIAGAVLNTILDPIFIFVFHWGIAGAAWATVLSQVISALMLMAYFKRFRSVQMERTDFKPDWSILQDIASLGMASFIFQASNLLVQIVTNNSLRVYGAASVYGADIPIAIAGIVAKVNVILVSVVLGIVQGAQPLASFNYGARQYDRVRETIRLSLYVVLTIGLVCWTSFELMPRPILAIFGDGSESYFEFGVRYMRIFFALAFVNGIQIFSSTFFPAIGKAKIGASISLLKQILLIIPALLILPIFLGVDGLAWALPIADGIAVLVAGYLLWRQYQRFEEEELAV